MKYKNEQGTCPYCKGKNLEYGTIEIGIDCIFYPYTCKDCGIQGREWYGLKFDGHEFRKPNGKYINLYIDDEKENEL